MASMSQTVDPATIISKVSKHHFSSASSAMAEQAFFNEKVAQVL